MLFVIAILLLFGHSDIPLEELKAKYTNAAASFIGVDGMNVHYRDEGNPTDSIPLVLIHGTVPTEEMLVVCEWFKTIKTENRSAQSAYWWHNKIKLRIVFALISIKQQL